MGRGRGRGKEREEDISVGREGGRDGVGGQKRKEGEKAGWGEGRMWMDRRIQPFGGEGRGEEGRQKSKTLFQSTLRSQYAKGGGKGDTASPVLASRWHCFVLLYPDTLSTLHWALTAHPHPNSAPKYTTSPSQSPHALHPHIQS